MGKQVNRLESKELGRRRTVQIGKVSNSTVDGTSGGPLAEGPAAERREWRRSSSGPVKRDTQPIDSETDADRETGRQTGPTKAHIHTNTQQEAGERHVERGREPEASEGKASYII
jgi:hypothetical protein